MEGTAPRDDASWRAEYLRNLSASDWAQRYKWRSFELIGVRPGARVLDIGCGLGEDVLSLSRIVGPEGRVIGVDRDAEMLKRATANELPRNVELREADAHSLPFTEEAFDAARIDRVLQHAGEAAGAINEMARVLRTGGRGVAIEPDWGTYAVDLPERALVRRVLDSRSDAYGDDWVGRKLHRLFHEAGFCEVAVEPVHVVMTDFAQARGIIDLAQAHQFGVRSGALSAEDAQRWTELIVATRKSPAFFAAITLFMVAGTRTSGTSGPSDP